MSSTFLTKTPRGHLAGWIGVVILLAVGWVISTATAEGGERASPDATIAADAGLEHLAERARRGLPGIRAQVARRLGWPYEGPAPAIFIVRDYDRMREVARAGVPRWAVGLASPSRALIVIRADLLAAGYGSGLMQVLRHEWVHLSWGRHARSDRRVLPLWVEEGLAEEIGGGISVDAGAALDLAVTFDRLLSFQDLEQRFPADPRQADLAYKQGRSWVRHFLTREGWPRLRRILALLANGGDPTISGTASFADVLRRETGLSIGEWHVSWQRAVASEARPWFHLLLRDFPGLIFSSLALVGAVAFFFLLRRRRRQLAELPDGPAFPPDALLAGEAEEISRPGDGRGP